MGKVSILRGRPDRWTEFKQRYIELITEALLLLRAKDNLKKHEPTLNRLLYQCIVETNLNLNLDYLPSTQANNPPQLKDTQKAKSEDSMPDFSWLLMDPTASYADCVRDFVLECKLLGNPTSKDWILTKEYVIDGIRRFFLVEKGYGKGCETGAMAGFIKDMDFDSILNEVNSYILKHEPSIPLLAMPTNGWQTQGVSYLAHSFQRTFVPLDFFLQHFWIDMRDCQYQTSPEAERKSIESDSSLFEETRKRGKKKSIKGGSTQQRHKPSQLELPLENSDGPIAAQIKNQEVDL